MATTSFAPWQFAAINNPFTHFAMFGGVACVRRGTLIETLKGRVPIEKLSEGDLVYSIGREGKLELSRCGKPILKGHDRLIKMKHSRGVFVAHPQHLVLRDDGSWTSFSELRSGDQIVFVEVKRGQAESPQGQCASYYETIDPQMISHQGPCAADLLATELAGQSLLSIRLDRQFQTRCAYHRPADEQALDHISCDDPYSCSFDIKLTQVSDITFEKISSEYWDIPIPGNENYLAEGLIHHNTGKTFTGSHFAINMILRFPSYTGFIGANTYDQLSQATLKEFFEWLEFYGFDYVSDRMAPREWNYPKGLKSYRNTVLVRNRATKKVSLIFTRVLSFANPLRGLEFTWYWLDETRDTKQDTHEVVLSRLRETKGYMKGIITTTTNGEDWTYDRFVKGGGKKDKLYGAMHVPTSASLNAGIIDQTYYDTMAKSYSKLFAMQELDAKHVNLLGGLAYYAASDSNRQRRAPWGDEVPNPQRPLIVGCDFNFAPAPFVWMVGQLGPDLYSSDGLYYGEMIHWFYEITNTSVSTVYQTLDLLRLFPGFFYHIFGDCSGGVGTTSNAGEADYNQMSDTLNEAGAIFSIDYFQDDVRQNPRVKLRVEAMNSMFANALGEVRMTYDPVNCPLFDADVKFVGWKQVDNSGTAKLSGGGRIDLTHATDGAGYAIIKLFPPGMMTRLIEGNRSTVRESYGLIG